MSEPRMVLAIFTNHYPFSPGEEFLESEVEILRKYFRLCIVPMSERGKLQSVPKGVETDYSLLGSIEKLSRKRMRRAVLGLSNLRFLGEKRTTIFSKRIYQMINYSALGTTILDWFEKRCNLEKDNMILYSYWLTFAAFGVSLIKEKFPNITAVSRAHRHDLYEHVSPKPLPYRKKILEMLDRVFCISEDGRNYLLQRYPDFARKIIVSRLGTEDFGLSRLSENGFQILSCSSITEVKRIDLIIAGVERFAQSIKPEKVFWTHIGSGPLADQMLIKARELVKCDNLEYSFTGQLTHSEVLDHFRNNPVDVFVNTSSSEGLPVSIMEAMSFGIPVVATDVGGTSELVSNDAGALLASHCTPEDVCKGIMSVFLKAKDPTVRDRARRKWETHAKADVNFKKFAELLIDTFEQNKTKEKKQ
ncbi:MAG TPA: glycosyltransferase [Mesotoga infera]|mgnify:FL=1|jgi:colanic acid/amylovoran biosynthesis glycosyltransferase|nr:glycosyltransferase [Mesotoga infera]HRV03158.1 glycosyltransferase [Mesotoga sp.]